MVTIELPNNGLFSNLYTLTGLPVKSTVTVTNNSSYIVYIAQQTLAPSSTTLTFPLQPFETALIHGSSLPIWVKGNGGKVVVQSISSFVLDSQSIDPRVYLGLQGLTTQSFTEANCKNGTQYEFTTYELSVAQGAVRDFIIVTGTKPILIKNRTFSFTGSRLTTTLYHNPVYTGGTPLTYYNLSNMNPVAGEAVILGGATVSSPGTQISPTFTLIGGVPQGGQSVLVTNAESSSNGLERVLAPNSVYLYQTVNTGTATELATKNTWYEGELSTIAI